ncbi:MAG: TonB-dependent receptor [Acidobacteriota bacterium]
MSTVQAMACRGPVSPGAARRAVLIIVFALICGLLGGPPSAQARESGSLTGRVTPAHDHDFILSTARIPDLSRWVDVEANGDFRFDSLPAGSYLLEIRVPSLGVVAERVEIRAGEETKVEIELKPGVHSEEIVVSASADARDPFELATPTTSLSGLELELRVESSLGETLGQEPGVHSTFFGPGSSRPVIRGQAGGRVRTLEDGIGSGDASAVSVDHTVTLEPSQAERIEIIRGPGTLLYGSSAIGGVVNVIDERIPTARGPKGVHGSIDLSAGSVSDERRGTIDLEGGGQSWAWTAGATVREADDYEIPGFARLEDDEHDEHEDEGEHDEDEHDEHGEEENPFGFVPNTDIDTRSARAGVTYFFGDRGFLGVSVSGFDTEYGLPGGLEHGEHGEEHGEHDEHDDGEHDEHDDGEHDEHDDGEHDEHDDDGEHDEHDEHDEGEHDEHEEGVPVRIDMEQRRFDLRGQLNQPFQGFQALKVRLGTTDYEHIELEGDEEGTFFFNEFLESRIELVQERRGNHSGSFGLQYSDRDLEAIGAEAFIPATTTEQWALFTLQEFERGPVTWQFGARFETQDSDAAGVGSRSHDGLSASAGLIWQATDAFSLAVSASRAVRLPAVEELFSNGLHVATQAFEVGDPSLEEEVGLGFDLSLRTETELVSGELTFFRQDFSDYIFQAFTGEEEEGFPVVLYSQQDAVFEGVELKGRVELLEREDHHMHLSLMGDWVEAELDRGGNLPRIPPFRLGGGLHYHSERWNAAAEVRWIDDQTDVAENESPTDGYTMVHASLGYRFLFGNQILDLLLRGRNLTDEDARSHTSFLKNVAPLPGRNITLSAKLRF